MRAGRLLTMLALLQEQGRTTTATLAARLEVSRRTVLRDLATLGEAGVPLVTYAGPGGGVELMHGWRTALGTVPAGLVADHGPTPDHAVGALLLRDAERACREGLALEVTTADGPRVLRPVLLMLRSGRWWLGEAGPDEDSAAAGLLALDLVRSHRLRL